uniref:peptidylprolyl isomerase n=1 Tax=Polyblepharides amylifera TaxID=1486889 RepID=A0A7R9SV02_9CHLO|mmetsp:Transcript_1163/g.1634  ORF Transcript_1163/g.1634 Transcript_1163/m.1634 type:complete len:249 (+) Transcript_1163:88-834(+)|eukprot:CAMPEP_0196580162 /NCGR_PEP_ID=MMETSP1081-20130531/27512_1 /TAXON_ID=36882 /ORGANISM="Pyramimonas amylifera, Strain CCMP720" /LENGTH=248 /DNA_ID=CAMNT_0041899961 /DNA_START=69 /DNA_END=815 /DNA_ORIENTATION=+
MVVASAMCSISSVAMLNRANVKVTPTSRASVIGTTGKVSRCGLKVWASSQASEVHDSRRQLLVSLACAPLAALAPQMPGAALAAAPVSVLCDAECETFLAAAEMVTLANGLQYKDIVKGTGPQPAQGVQFLVDWVAMVKNPKDGSMFVFDDTRAKGKPMEIRVFDNPEISDLIVGLNEGIKSMKVGGIRRIYVPGPLAFPKGLASAPGRPRVAPLSEVVFDVQVLYIPGMEEEEDEDYVLDVNAMSED